MLKPILGKFHSRFNRNYANEFWALKNISFEVEKGEALGIIGRNGAGKSTLLQILTGTLNPTAGNVEVKGRVAALLELGAGFNPEFTGRENVFLNASILGFSKKEVEERFSEILDFSEIGNFIDQPVKTYSSGMFVRLAFSVQACLEPDILIVDEALSVGDVFFVQKCHNRIEHLLKTRNTTFIFVTHDMGAIEKYCRKAITLHNGEINYYGDKKTAILRYYRPKTNLKTQNENTQISKYNNSILIGDSDKINLVSVTIHNYSGDQTNVISNEEYFEINILFELKTNMNLPVIDITIKDYRGIPIFATSTLMQRNISISHIKNGTKIRTVFKIKNSLSEGDYSLSLGICDSPIAFKNTDELEVFDLNQLLFIASYENVTDIKVITPLESFPKFHGMVHLDTKVTLNIESNVDK